MSVYTFLLRFFLILYRDPFAEFMTPSVLRGAETPAEADTPLTDWSETDKSVSPEIKPVAVSASIVQTRAQKKKAAAEQQTPTKSSDKGTSLLDTRGHTSDRVRDLDLKTSAAAGFDSNPSAVDTQLTLNVVKAPLALPAQGFSAGDYEAFVEFLKMRNGTGTAVKGSSGAKDAGVVVVGPTSSETSTPKRAVQPKKGPKRKHDEFDDVFSGPDSTQRLKEGTVGSIHDNTSSPGQIRTYVTGLPHACEVNPLVLDLQPDSMKDHYAALPPLRLGVFTSWSADTRGGNPPLARLKMMGEHLNRGLFFSALRFDKAGSFVNPSVASPMGVTGVASVGSNTRFHLYCGPEFALFTSVAYVRESLLVSGKARNYGRTKLLMANLFGAEYERTVSFLCNVTNQPSLAAQMYQNMLEFATKPESSGPSSSPGSDAGESPYKKRKGADTSLFVSSAFATKSTSQPAPGGDSALPFEAVVPVFDGRATSLSFSDCLKTLHDMPRYTKAGGEVYPGSIVVVGYHVSQYYNSTRKSEAVSLNLQWIMVLGDDEEVEMAGGESD
ncbi:hypothetical protein C8F01DRAFT_1365536 [Mycena amicta]|nr:hypothetical protein C8F01DRAFT_1365536 [Mycena amicta]